MLFDGTIGAQIVNTTIMLSSYLKERKHFACDHLPQPFEVTGSKGSSLFNEDGKKYIDFLGAWCVENLSPRHIANPNVSELALCLFP